MWIAAMVLLAAVAYLFSIAPALFVRKKAPSWLRKAAFAHRGLHDGGIKIPENSLAAFARAADRGLGIELDVHLTRDGKLAVHHDRSLKRICGRDDLIDQTSMDALRGYRLQGTEETIPSLEDVLSLVDGRVPLLIEMKYDEGADHEALPLALIEAMQGYPGPWCAESFDPLMLRCLRRHAPGIMRGQLSFDQKDLGEDLPPLLRVCLAHLLMNCLSRPHFVAYGPGREKNFSYRLVQRLFHPLTGAWTVRSKTEFEKLRDQNDLLIFESFTPYVTSIEKEK